MTFKGGRGVTQGDPLSPTIFNVVVDTVVRHWVTGVIVDVEERGELGKEGRHQAALFYADDGMVTSSDPQWLHGAFNTLVGLFDRVGLRGNVGKTVGMVCHPCQAVGTLSEAAYRRRVIREGPMYKERLEGQVACGACGELMAAGSLSSHMMTQHGKVAEICQQWSTLAAGTGPRTFRMTFPATGGLRNYPVAVWPLRVTTRTAMRVHFLHQHVLNTVVILEEGNSPHSRCA